MSSISRLPLASAVEKEIAGFDETIAGRKSQQQVSVEGNAVALSSSVCYFSSSTLKWTRSFHPHAVCRVACNSSGSVVAATMDNGTVSILKGCDGTVLATRRIAAQGCAGFGEISFFSHDNQDTLLIQPPELDDTTPLILVSNIHGERLNSNDDGVVADAAKNMLIHALKLQDDIRLIKGFYASLEAVKFVVMDGNGQLTLWEYHLQDKTCTLIHKHLPCDFQLSESILEISSCHDYAIVTCQTKLVYINLPQWQVARQQTLPSKPVALKFLTPCQDNSLAMVVVTKTNQNILETKVWQLSTSNESLEEPHILYEIPVPLTVKTLAIASLTEEMLTFRCLTLDSNHQRDCHDFTCGNETIAVLRMLLHDLKFEKVNLLLEKIGSDVLIADRFSNFHPSEITLAKLKVVLESSSMKESRDCLVQLATGYSNPHGKRALLAAANLVLQWPSSTKVTLGEISTGLLGSIQTLTTCNAAGKDDDTNQMVLLLQEKLKAIQYLENVLGKTVPLSTKFWKVQTVKDLFECLLQHDYFVAAEPLVSMLTLDQAVSSFLSFCTRDKNPRYYANVLRQILGKLAINHELLPPLQTWACKIADDLDDAGNLSSAIFLLEILERATKLLRVKVHSSFATHTPFVEMVARKKQRISKKEVSILDASFASTSSSAMDNATFTKENDLERPNPTILELGRMKRGAQKSRARKFASLEAMEESEDCVESKLVAARCLECTRELGLARKLVSLREFETSGGAQYMAKELIRLYSANTKSHPERVQKLKVAQEFCSTHQSDFDQALKLYTREICGGKNTTSRKIEEAASLSQCCITTKTKCQVVLVTLRAALFCRFSPTWLSKLSQEAIERAAGDSSLRSELEEASRLLLIDGIVGRYCGDGAKELFHVDNPRHAIRLVEFMAASFYSCQNILSDTLDLCDAFVHLSREDACSNVLQNAITMQNQDERLSSNLLTQLYAKNALLAKTTFSRVIVFCVDMIEDLDSLSKEQVSFATSCAYRLSQVAMTHLNSHVSTGYGGACQFDEARLEGLVEDFRHLLLLQNDHGVFLSVADLHNPKKLVETATDFLVPLVESYTSREGTERDNSIATKTKRVCSLLSSRRMMNDNELWFAAVGSSACNLVKNTSGVQCFEFLQNLGILSELDCSLSARCCLAVALAFCKKAFRKSHMDNEDIRTNMKYVIMASSLLKDYLVKSCPFELLGAAVTLGELCDIITQILIRADEGVGEEMDKFRKMLQNLTFTNSKNSQQDLTTCNNEDALRPTLHSSWYVGDGLLLPPSETLIRGLEFCKQSLAQGSLEESTLGLYSFVAGRGAYSLALRVLGYSAMMQVSSKRNDPSENQNYLTESIHQTTTALAERSLGGSGNGILSSVVDSHLAVSFLLHLPLKLAFKVYKSSLPTAMSTRDFERLGKLASVGKALHVTANINAKLMQNWKRQEKFVSQCHQLAIRAKWWRVLQNYSVKFDLHKFEGKGQYSAALLPTLIANMAQRNGIDPQAIMQTSKDFCQAFGLGSEMAIQVYLEYLLSPGFEDGGARTSDIRFKLASLENLAKGLLREIQAPLSRLNVLRKCLIRLEASNCNQDYERLAVLSGLYHVEVSAYLRRQEKEVSKSFMLDLELVDRRLDALAILSSYFQARHDRPPFGNFFAPLPDSLEYGGKLTPTIRAKSEILGSESSSDESSTNETSFDPLSPLDGILGSSCSSAVTSALAPLCSPLGVPRGYIHARTLIARFKKSKEEQVALPSFENDVMPVLNRLKSPPDVADLAEWCSAQYSFDNEDKLKSLNYAMNFAMQASSEAEERHTIRQKDGDSRQQEAKALERVKRISTKKDLLVDRLAINAILSSVGITSEKYCALSSIVDELMKRLEEQVWSKSQFIPEQFVEIFLTESSLLAAEACLQGLSVGKFQQLCILCHQICKSVAERYSHVQVGDTVRRLSQRWLFHGDQFLVSTDSNDDNNVEKKDGLRKEASRAVNHADAMSALLPDIEEEDTINFVMDLNCLAEEADVGASQCTQEEERKYTSEEEPSSLKFPGASSEISDMASRRASLRIAFVMAYADGYHANSAGTVSSGIMKENAKPADGKVNSKQKSRGGLLAKIGYSESRKQYDSIIEHSRELLRIIFAKSGSSDWVERYQSNPNDSRIAYPENPQKTITFAMRHRALRASSILCPQEALEAVILEEGLLRSSKTSSLKKCSFGAYVAKEMEELGLPLPHSDLSQLSTVNFSSYARTLWRHHRDSKVSKGRLLLLIIQMYLRESISDYDFFLGIISEIESSNLPRTLLLALEATSSYMEGLETMSAESFWSNSRQMISSVVKGLMNLTSAEFKKVLESSDRSSRSIQDALATCERLGRLVKSFGRDADGQRNLEQFAKSQLELASMLPSNTDKDFLNSLVAGILKHITNGETSKHLAEQIFQSNALAMPCSEASFEQSEESDAMQLGLGKIESSRLSYI